MGNVTPVSKADQDAGEMYIECRPRDESAAVVIRSDADVGALFVEFDVGSDDVSPMLLTEDMEMKWHLEDGKLRLIIYSMTNASIPAGETELLLLEGTDAPTVTQVSGPRSLSFSWLLWCLSCSTI